MLEATFGIPMWQNAMEDMRIQHDVQPVKSGHWENTNTPNHLRCSKCEVIHFIAQYPHGEINFCPNCGARMDLKDGDTNG